MKGYVVTLLNISESVRVANRCVASGVKYNMSVEKVSAVYKTESLEELKKEKLAIQNYDTSFSNVGAVMGNFVTQYRIWKRIASSGYPGVVLEHDAVFIDKLPNLNGHDIVNLAKPSYGNFKTKKKPGIYPMFSKVGGYIPGAHGYYVTPKGAQQLIAKAKQVGAGPCDIFLNTTNFPSIKEIWPWVIEAHDSFSCIQNKKGCLAKHNYGNGFKIL